MYYMIDQYVDYHAMFVNYEGVKAVQDVQRGKQVDNDINFTRVNKDFREKKSKLLEGQHVEIKTDANEEIKKKMEDVKKRISEAKEGFIKVDDKGNEVFVEGRKF